jgi:hypothetical protein
VRSSAAGVPGGARSAAGPPRPKPSPTCAAPQVQIEGLPATGGWPAAGEIKQLLSARIGRPFSTEELEEDVRTLLGTGGWAGTPASGCQAFGAGEACWALLCCVGMALQALRGT